MKNKTECISPVYKTIKPSDEVKLFLIRKTLFKYYFASIHCKEGGTITLLTIYWLMILGAVIVLCMTIEEDDSNTLPSMFLSWWSSVIIVSKTIDRHFQKNMNIKKNPLYTLWLADGHYSSFCVTFERYYIEIRTKKRTLCNIEIYTNIIVYILLPILE